MLSFVFQRETYKSLCDASFQQFGRCLRRWWPARSIRQQHDWIRASALTSTDPDPQSWAPGTFHVNETNAKTTIAWLPVQVIPLYRTQPDGHTCGSWLQRKGSPRTQRLVLDKVFKIFHEYVINEYIYALDADRADNIQCIRRPCATACSVDFV